MGKVKEFSTKQKNDVINQYNDYLSFKAIGQMSNIPVSNTESIIRKWKNFGTTSFLEE